MPARIYKRRAKVCSCPLTTLPIFPNNPLQLLLITTTIMYARQLATVSRRSFATSVVRRAEGKSFTDSVKETAQSVASKLKNTGSIGSKFEEVSSKCPYTHP